MTDRNEAMAAAGSQALCKKIRDAPAISIRDLEALVEIAVTEGGPATIGRICRFAARRAALSRWAIGARPDPVEIS